MPKYLLYSLIFIVLLLNNGCHKDNNVSACDEKIPVYADVFRNSVFSSLKYHRKIEVDKICSKNSSDIWADSKFDYRSALQFRYIHPNNNNFKKQCIDGATLRLALPLDAKQKEILQAFTDKLAAQAQLNAGTLQKNVNNALSKGDSVKLVADDHHLIQVKAGVAHHPFRGDFFIVSLEKSGI